MKIAISGAFITPAMTAPIPMSAKFATGSEYSSPIDISYKYHPGIRISGHRHINDIAVLQIEFRNASRALHHYRIKSRGESVESLMRHLSEPRLVIFPKISVCRAVTFRAAVHHHL